jgi:uncharacterized membrane protein
MTVPKNWRTTTLSVIAIILVLLTAIKAVMDNDPSTNVDINVFLASLFAAAQGLFAKDSVVTGGTVAATNEAVKRIE